MAFSFFFRDLPTLEKSASELRKQTQGKRVVKIWDAGCAMGQELYTMLFLLSEIMGKFAFQNVQLFASDIDKTFGDIVLKAEYSKADIERIPELYLKKYFVDSEKDGYFKIIDCIRNKVRFVHNDLTKLLPIDHNFDLIICKNVLLHLQPSQRIDVFKMFHKALVPNGLIANENTQKLPKVIEPLFRQIASGVQLYRKV